eukprot:CAMPEP_0177736858 /NCGR_PEP_ID=MMETSP0484_2-20121128/25571_1 /TAXON_ID=354590 /ORGANISM="Rhodomonas lens, Strain RHODO" /LENGTH=506 /DNA_ID=CAMNT_0019250591 /DNA_START=155 /DNA_END=1674 /DNA_ORIENTATION=-
MGMRELRRVPAMVSLLLLQIVAAEAFTAPLSFKPCLLNPLDPSSVPKSVRTPKGVMAFTSQSQFDPSSARRRITRAVHEMWTTSKERTQPFKKKATKQPQDPGVQDPVHPPPGRDSQVLVIGVAGGSGGGKSVFCTKLEAMLKDICPTVVLSHDSYYRDGPEVDRDCGGNWDCPDALNTHELVADLQKLKRGDLAEIPIYSFAANARVQDQSIPRRIEAGTKGVLLVEGLMVLHDEALRREMDVRVYVDCDEDTRFMRRLARDTHPMKGRGRTVADVYGAWAKNVKPNHHRYVEPTKRFAHLIVPHHGVFADPGHLLAVGEDPTALLDAYVSKVYIEGGEGAIGPEVAAPDLDSKQQQQLEQQQQIAAVDDAAGETTMWPALYMLQAYVRDFSTGAAGVHKGPSTITINHYRDRDVDRPFPPSSSSAMRCVTGTVSHASTTHASQTLIGCVAVRADRAQDGDYLVRRSHHHAMPGGMMGGIAFDSAVAACRFLRVAVARPVLFRGR